MLHSQTQEVHKEYSLQALGKRVRELRVKRGYSQEAFADLCQVHRTFMGSIERGETNLSFKNLLKLSSALGITLSVLLAGVEKGAAELARSAQQKK